MILSHLGHDIVLEVVRNAIDIEQIYAIHGHRDPTVITANVMATANFAWAAWHEGRPVAVFGAARVHEGVYGLYLMATPEFGKIILPLTKFVRNGLIPELRQIGARRLEIVLHADNWGVHRWVRLLGATPEFVKKNYAPDGSDYVGYVISTKPTKPPIVPFADVSPGARRAGPSNDTSDV